MHFKGCLESMVIPLTCLYLTDTQWMIINNNKYSFLCASIILLLLCNLTCIEDVMEVHVTYIRYFHSLYVY